MDTILVKQFSWFNFLTAAAVLFLVYFSLQFLHRLLGRVHFLRGLETRMQTAIQRILLVYEPLVLLILIGIFVFINPVLHGFIFFILFLGGFAHLRNYLAGRVVQTNEGLAIGGRIKTDIQQGIIAKVARLGLELQTDDGLHFIPYRQLLINGYTLVSGQEIGGFHQFKLVPKKENERKDHVRHLSHLLASTPYLDTNYKPEFIISDSPERAIQTRLLLKEESHLEPTLSLIEDWGYTCQLTKLV